MKHWRPGQAMHRCVDKAGIKWVLTPVVRVQESSPLDHGAGGWGRPCTLLRQKFRENFEKVVGCTGVGAK